MNPLDTYIVRGILKWWITGQIVFSLLYLMSQLIRVAPLFADSGVSNLLSPGTFGVLVPIWAWSLLPSFMVAVFMQAAGMAEQGELTAVSSAGIRTWRLARWPMVLGLAFFCVSVWAWTWAVPATQQVFHNAVKRVMARGIVNSLGPGVFHHPVDGVVFYADRMDADSRYRGVYLEQNGGTGMRVLVAETALVTLLSETETLRIVLREGELILPGEQLNVVSFREMVFQVNIGLALHTGMRHFSSVAEMASLALFRKIRGGTARRAETFEFFRRLSRPLEGLLLVLISIMLSFRVAWKYRFTAIAVSVAIFLVSQVLQRALELAMQTDILSPPVAACVPTAIFLMAAGVVGASGMSPYLSRSLFVVKK
jgi:lipopolysaccharide export LptBFGC system permease protein LptF